MRGIFKSIYGNLVYVGKYMLLLDCATFNTIIFYHTVSAILHVAVAYRTKCQALADYFSALGYDLKYNLCFARFS